MKELFARLMTRQVLAFQLGLAALFANLLALAQPLFSIQVFNRYVTHGVDATLATLTIGVLLAVALEFVFRHVRFKLGVLVSLLPDRAMQEQSFAALTRIRLAALERLPPGVRQEILRGLETVRAAYGPANINAVLDIPFSLIFLVTLMLLSPLLGMVALSLTAIGFGLGILSLRLLKQPIRALTEATVTAGALVVSANASADMIRAFNAGGPLRRQWEDSRLRLHALSVGLESRRGNMQSLALTVSAVMAIAITAIGAIQVVGGHLSIGALMGANILAARAMGPITRFAALAGLFTEAQQALERLRDFNRLPVEPVTGTTMSVYTGRLEFRDLAFAHPGGTGPLFESFGLRIEPGQVVLINGPNGAGKSTLARLILGLLEPARGQILVEGVDLRQIDPAWWRRQVVYLPQEPTFMNASLADNIRLGNPSMDAETLGHIVNAAGLRPFLDASPRGYDLPILDQGRNLALGIRRRLALARALATEGRLVVMDEPGEGMDAEGGKAMLSTVQRFIQEGRTIILLSHDYALMRGVHHQVDLGAKPVPRVASLAVAPVMGAMA